MYNYAAIKRVHLGLHKGLLSTMNAHLYLVPVLLRIGSVPICHCDPQGVNACRSGHELELTTSRVNRGH